jgi:hypothetical protein
MSAGTCCMATSVADTAALLGGRWRLWGSSREARKLKQLVELPLHEAWDLAKRSLMKGKASSAAGIYWPIIPKWGDRQVCLITRQRLKR